MGQRKDVKLQDIADSLGVSIVTVSNALKGRTGVSDSLRRRVKEKAQELSYELPENWGKKRGIDYRFGVVIAERYVKEHPSYYMELYKQIAQTVTRYGGLTMLEVVDESRERMDTPGTVFEMAEIDGILIVGEMDRPFITYIMKNSEVPVVCIDFYEFDTKADYVIADGYRGMQKMTQKLIDSGHTRIGFVGTPYATQSIMDRYLGYCKALMKNGLKERDDWVIYDREPEVYGDIYEMELPKELPTAFVCNCCKTAYVLIEQLQKKGYRVPDDISVVAYDYVYPEYKEGIQLTTYDSNGRGMAQSGVKILIQRIEKKKDAKGIHPVEGKIVIGNSIKKWKG